MGDMIKSATATHWQTAITERFEIQPTIEAMQRHLLFTLRSASVQSSEAGHGEFRTDVDLGEGQNWSGTGASAEEAMARVLLVMTRSDGTLGDGPNGE
jgi:hypothetical protein